VAPHIDLSDAELTVLLKEGDHGAYAEIYQRYHVLLYLYAYKKLKDKETAKDLVQEIFLSLWNKRKSYTFHTDLAGYLYRSVRNRAFDIFAHQKIEQQYVDSLQTYLDTDTATTDYLLREKEITKTIDNEIALMPKGMREVFILSRKHYLSHKQIAEQLNMSEDAVNKQVKRALKTLRVKLGLFTFLVFCYHCAVNKPRRSVDERRLVFMERDGQRKAQL
jgi:RNA polymerase sigma-70 factor (family 1)